MQHGLHFFCGFQLKKNKTETALDITTPLSVFMRLIPKSQQIITERGVGKGVQQAKLTADKENHNMSRLH